MGIKDLLGEEEEVKETKSNRGTSGTSDRYGEDMAPWGTVERTSVEVERIEVEAVIGGVLQRVTLRGCAPDEVGDVIRAWDAQAKFRDDFPRRGGGGRDTKLVRCYQIAGAGLSCYEGDEVRTVLISKAKRDGLAEAIAQLGRLNDDHTSKLADVLGGETSKAILLKDPEEQFGVKYWMTDDGKAFLDSVQAEPPAEE